MCQQLRAPADERYYHQIVFSLYMCVLSFVLFPLFVQKEGENKSKRRQKTVHERDRPAEIVKSVDVHHVVVFDALKGYGYSGSNETSIIAH